MVDRWCVAGDAVGARRRVPPYALLLLLSLASLLLLPRVAGAEIVYASPDGSAINIAQDDGGGAHAIVQATAPDKLSDPAVGLSSRVVMFSGSNNVKYWQHVAAPCTGGGIYFDCGTNYYGTESTGVYKLENGQVTRLSPLAGPCTQCTTVSEMPEPASDGTYVYDHQNCTGVIVDETYSCSTSVQRATIAGGSPTAFTSGTCTNTNLGDSEPSPDPVDPGRVAYAGCPSSGGELDVSGAVGAGLVIVAQNSDPGVFFSDPSWRPDGQQIVAYQGGKDMSASPGLYLLDPAGGSATAVLNAPVDPSPYNVDGTPLTFGSPRFIGNNTIVFDDGTNLYTVPASCRACSFPADAHLLVSNARDASWTPLELNTPGGAGGTGTTGGGGGPGRTGGPGGTSGKTDPISSATRSKGKFTQKTGIKLIVTLRANATIQIIVLDTRGHRLGVLKVKGRRGRNHITIKRVGKRALKPARYLLVVETIRGRTHSKQHTLSATLGR